MTAELSQFERPAPAVDAAGVRKHLALLLWLGSGVILFAGLGIAPVTRTQEARVQETAREMLGAGGHQWLIPKVNGRVRMQKPPLAYWLTAGSFMVFGVGEGAGRAPAALAGWLTVGLTAATAAWLFGRRAGFFAGAALLGSYLFFRNSRLAETDVLAMLFVTAGVYAVWRAYSAIAAGQGRPALWFHGAALAMALALLAKGPPAAYPLIFLVALAGVEGRWRVLWRFITSGAPLTLVVVAAPWFAYVAMDPTVRQLTGDLRNSAAGGGHSSLFLSYFPQLAIATAPWSGIAAVAIVAAAMRWGQDTRLRGLLIWFAAVFVPLCVWGNKQIHYLMPLLPPVMILVGWVIDEALSGGLANRAVHGGTGFQPVFSQPGTRAGSPCHEVSSVEESGLAVLVRRVTVATAAVVALGAPALVIGARQFRGHVSPADWAMAALLAIAAATALALFFGRGFAPAVKGLAVGGSIVVAVIVGGWSHSLDRIDAQDAAGAIRARYGDGPYAFMGNEDLPLCFHMGSVIPVVRKPDQLLALVAREPQVVLIESLGDDRRPPSPMVLEQMRFEDANTLYRVGVPILPPAAGAAQPEATLQSED